MTTDLRSFWEKHAKEYRTAFEKLEELANYLERTERRHLFQVVQVSREMKVLDLGCGTGRWAFEFAKHCKRVVAVDFAVGMIDRALKEASERGIKNIDFKVASVEKFRSPEKFDIIILSGVLVYFNDTELATILENIRQHLISGGKVISRETVAIDRRQELQNEFHEKINDSYSAIYRLPQEYQKAFTHAGMKLLYGNDFTPINFPMILYRRLIPDRYHHNRVLRRLLSVTLCVQYVLDPFLLRHKWTYRPIQNHFWKIKSMLFVYGIN